MFDRAAQVNAQFAGGSIRQEEVVAALHELGVREEQVTVIARADAGVSHAPLEGPGWFARLRGRLGAERETASAPVPDLLILVHLGRDDTLAGPVEAVLRRFGATQVEHYAPGRVPTRIGVAVAKAPSAAERGEPGWEDDGGGSANAPAERH